MCAVLALLFGLLFLARLLHLNFFSKMSEYANYDNNLVYSTTYTEYTIESSYLLRKISMDIYRGAMHLRSLYCTPPPHDLLQSEYWADQDDQPPSTVSAPSVPSGIH